MQTHGMRWPERGRMGTWSGHDKLLTLVQAFWLLPRKLPETQMPLLIDTVLGLTKQLRTRLRGKSECKVGGGRTRSNSKKIQEANELGCGYRLSDGPGPVTLSPLPP